jgi:hypothetical protein
MKKEKVEAQRLSNNHSHSNPQALMLSHPHRHVPWWRMYRMFSMNSNWPALLLERHSEPRSPRFPVTIGSLEKEPQSPTIFSLRTDQTTISNAQLSMIKPLDALRASTEAALDQSDRDARMQRQTLLCPRVEQKARNMLAKKI